MSFIHRLRKRKDVKEAVGKQGNADKRAGRNRQRDRALSRNETQNEYLRGNVEKVRVSQIRFH